MPPLAVSIGGNIPLVNPNNSAAPSSAPEDGDETRRNLSAMQSLSEKVAQRGSPAESILSVSRFKRNSKERPSKEDVTVGAEESSPSQDGTPTRRRSMFRRSSVARDPEDAAADSTDESGKKRGGRRRSIIDMITGSRQDETPESPTSEGEKPRARKGSVVSGLVGRRGSIAGGRRSSLHPGGRGGHRRSIALEAEAARLCEEADRANSRAHDAAKAMGADAAKRARHEWQERSLRWLAAGNARVPDGGMDGKSFGTPLKTWLTVHEELQNAQIRGVPLSEVARVQMMKMNPAARAIRAASSSAILAAQRFESEWKDSKAGKRLEKSETARAERLAQEAKQLAKEAEEKQRAKEEVLEQLREARKAEGQVRTMWGSPYMHPRLIGLFCACGSRSTAQILPAENMPQGNPNTRQLSLETGRTMLPEGHRTRSPP